MENTQNPSVEPSPPIILGRDATSYRVADLHTILRLYGIQFTSRTRRPELLELLRYFENSLSKTQRQQVISRMNGQNTPSVTPSPEDTGIEQDQASADIDPSEMQECLVCFETKVAEAFPSRRITSQCDHDAGMCSYCLQGHIHSELHDKVRDEVLCPECHVALNHKDVRELAARDDYNTYIDHLAFQALQQDADFRMCPYADCIAGELHEHGVTQPTITCHACGRESCFGHKVPWHDGQTCEEYDAVNSATHGDAERATQELLRRSTKRCPNEACGIHIQKEEGWEHMTCDNCHHEFCWQCFIDWNEVLRMGGLAHRRDCPLWADSTRISYYHPDSEEAARIRQMDLYRALERRRLERQHLERQHLERQQQEREHVDPLPVDRQRLELSVDIQLVIRSARRPRRQQDEMEQDSERQHTEEREMGRSVERTAPRRRVNEPELVSHHTIQPSEANNSIPNQQQRDFENALALLNTEI